MLSHTNHPASQLSHRFSDLSPGKPYNPVSGAAAQLRSSRRTLKKIGGYLSKINIR
ncbi:uncharacterized protein BDW70DRAFT_143177 [Aspergillus foveolatus]|uniref:uncharacterized protein n=1 Tax=Aspergillus foveolatus TaxID=210207 RepID=UPI003CCDE3A5